VPYEIKLYKRDPQTRLAPDSFRSVHPLGKFPVVTDGDLVLAESGAIVEHLLEVYDPERRLRPPVADRAANVWFRYFLHYAEGTAMPYFVMLLVFNTVVTQVPFLIRPLIRAVANAVKASYLEPNIRHNLEMLEGELGKHTWFCGDTFTGADIQLFFVVESAASAGYLGAGTPYPRLAAFLKRCQERPSYQRALARGGPFSLGV
jgi:glutathione S-transferase